MSRLPFTRRTATLVAVLVPLVALLIHVALRSGPLAPVAVTLVKIEQHALQPALFGVGHVEARQLHRIGPTAPGRLLALNVEVGDTVQAGQVLGEMDAVDSDARIRAQEAQIKRTHATLADATARQAHAERQARRYEQLFAERMATEEVVSARRQDLQLANAGLAAVREDQARAQSDLQALRAQRASLRLVSPVAGVVTGREIEPGTTVVAGQSVVEVVDPQSLWVNTRFDQVSAAGLAAGLPAQVALRSRRGQLLDAQVRRTELRADAVTEELLAKVAFKTLPHPLPPLGERAEVTVQLPALPAGPAVPNAALHRQGSQVGVWVPQDEGLRFAPLQLGRADLEGRVQVLSGLKSGDTIVLHSEKALSERTHIQVVERLPGVRP